MKTCIASIALMLSLVVLLLVAGLSAAAVADDDSKNAIRLPTDDGTGLADLLKVMKRATKEGEKQERPWRCCDLAVCTRSHPPTCWCGDVVDECPDACKDCVLTEDSRRICADRYDGDPGPRCKEDAGGLADVGASTARNAAAEAGKKDDDDDDKTRPWKCCDLQACTRSQPPTCRCRDVVKRCAKTCNLCEKVEGSDDHTGYRCLDTYHGAPAPPCGARRGGMMMRRAIDAILRGYGY